MSENAGVILRRWEKTVEMVNWEQSKTFQGNIVYVDLLGKDDTHWRSLSPPWPRIPPRREWTVGGGKEFDTERFENRAETVKSRKKKEGRWKRGNMVSTWEVSWWRGSFIPRWSWDLWNRWNDFERTASMKQLLKHFGFLCCLESLWTIFGAQRFSSPHAASLCNCLLRQQPEFYCHLLSNQQQRIQGRCVTMEIIVLG